MTEMVEKWAATLAQLAVVGPTLEIGGGAATEIDCCLLGV